MTKPVKGHRYKVYEIAGHVRADVSVGDVLIEHKYMNVKHELNICNMSTGEWEGSIFLVYVGEREMPGKFKGPLVEAREDSE